MCCILPSEYILSELYLELHVLYFALRVHSLRVVSGVVFCPQSTFSQSCIWSCMCCILPSEYILSELYLEFCEESEDSGGDTSSGSGCDDEESRMAE